MPDKRKRAAPEPHSTAKCRRTEQPVPDDAPKPFAPTFLDILPPEVGEIIVAYLCAGRPNQDARHLLESSPQQKRVVLTSLVHPLTISTATSESDDTFWLQYASQLPALVVSLGGTPGKLLAEPFLSTLQFRWFTARKVTLSGDSFLLDDFDIAWAVLHLCLNVSSIRQRSKVLDFLSRSRVSKLELNCELTCRERNNRNCFFYYRENEVENPFGTALVTSCPNLTCLALDCTHSNIWFAVDKFKCLRELAVTTLRPAPDSVVPSLRSLEKIQVKARNAFTVATEVSDRITALSTPQWYLFDKKQIQGLGKCTHLVKLQIQIIHGAECMLKDALSDLHELRQLQVSWRVVGSRKWPRPLPGRVFELVEAVPLIQYLFLENVKISLPETCKILRLKGANLRFLRLPITRQGGSVLIRLQGLLYSASRHCRELRYFNSSETFPPSKLVGWGPQPTNFGAPVWGPKKMVIHQIAHVVLGVCRLRQTAPFVDVDELSEAFGRSFKAAFALGEIEKAFGI